ncbi:hypothetical protein SAMN04244548_02977 [Paracoccus pantotrophus]|nr:hypothetical protein SAMN04244548_02977 [Paracoccus pantotrophus]
MSISTLPVPLMTAAERAGFREAIAFFRSEAARMRRAANMIGEAPAAAAPADAFQQRQKNQILELCAYGVDRIADQAEAQLQPLLN